MSEHLFDPSPYGLGADKRKQPTRREIANDGAWWLLPQVGRAPDSKVHRKAGAPRNAYGADTTVCGRYGQLIPVPINCEITAVCEQCDAATTHTERGRAS